MKERKQLFASLIAGACLAAPAVVAQESNDGDFYFWRWGHMDGPHTASQALGISRDGKTVVGSTLVVDFWRAWRSDIDWAISTDDGLPPLFNELFVQEDLGIIAPSQPSAAYASSDMTDVPNYDLTTLTLDWGGSKPVGTILLGTVSYGIEWLLPVKDSVEDGDYVAVPDYGGGLADMEMKDVSVEGLITVGFGHNKRGPLAFRADLTDPLVPVVKSLTIAGVKNDGTIQTLQWSKAEAVSGDGMMIAGYGGSKVGNRAFVSLVLDPNTDPITLESYLLPSLDGGMWSEAYAMTPDGAVIAGRSDSPKGPQACIWFVDSTTGNWIVKPLGGLSKKKLDSCATGIAYRPGSPVGELIVVGRSATIQAPSEAFVWTGNPIIGDALELDGIPDMYTVEYVVTHTGVGEVSLMGSEWVLKEATGVSWTVEDGTRMVGWGTNPEGGTEAWVITAYPFEAPVFDHEG